MINSFWKIVCFVNNLPYQLIYMPNQVQPTTRLIVKNLAKNIATTDLKKSFSNVGRGMTDCRVVTNPTTGESRRFAYVGFKSVAEAETALKAIDKTYIGSSKVNVEFAVDRTEMASVKTWSNKNKTKDAVVGNQLTKEQEEILMDHGRIYVTNIAHSSTSEEIEEWFSQFGAVREVHLVMDEDLGRPRGIAFVTFVFPKDAIKAVSEGNGKYFQGRVLHMDPAVEKQKKQVAGGGEDKKQGRMTDFQRKRLEQKIANASDAVHTWNLLYTSANAAAAAMADQIESIDRSDILLGKSGKDDVAVRAAIAETEIISQTKEWLITQGVNPAAFERKGSSVLNSAVGKDIKRSNDTIIIKHLPTDVELDSLRFMFTRNGETLIKFLISPSRTVAIAQFADPGSAKRSFTANAFRKYKASPLYLEWAPQGTFMNDAVSREDEKVEEPQVVEEDIEEPAPVAIERDAATMAQIRQDLDGVQTCRLCVRNVAFEATTKDLRKLFGAYGRVVAVRLPTKMAASGDASTGIRKQHRGFAFVEFTSRAEMAKAYEALQSTHLYGRKLVLEPAAMEDGSVEAARAKAVRREEIASGTVASESKRRRLEAVENGGGDEEESFGDLLLD